MTCEVKGPHCLTDLEYEGERFCMHCYSMLMPYSTSNRLLRHEYDKALLNYRRGHKPPPVHDPILNTIRALGGLR